MSHTHQNTPAVTTPSVAVTSDGHVLAAYNKDYASINLVRLNADGSYDSTFGTGGVVTTSIPGVNCVPTDVALGTVNSTPMIYVAGTAGDSWAVNHGGNFFVARYTATGVLDTSYGNSGFALSTGNRTAFAFTPV